MIGFCISGVDSSGFLAREGKSFRSHGEDNVDGRDGKVAAREIWNRVVEALQNEVT